MHASNLIVLLHGVAFRSTERGSWYSHDANATATEHKEQFQSLSSVRTHVVGPAAQSGWDVTLLADVVLPKALFPQWKHAVQSASLKLAGQRVSAHHVGETQVQSVLASLDWAKQTLSKELFQAGTAAAMLLLRVDLLIKTDLPLPPPPTGAAAASGSGALRFPFHVRSDLCAKKKMMSMLSDVLIFVPGSARERFETVLQHHRDSQNLHTIVGKNPNRGVDETLALDFETMLPATFEAEADSSAEWNPLYQIIGRPAAPKPTKLTPPVKCPKRT